MGESLRRKEGRASSWLEAWREAWMVMHMANNLEGIMADGQRLGESLSEEPGIQKSSPNELILSSTTT